MWFNPKRPQKHDFYRILIFFELISKYQTFRQHTNSKRKNRFCRYLWQHWAFFLIHSTFWFQIDSTYGNVWNIMYCRLVKLSVLKYHRVVKFNNFYVCGKYIIVLSRRKISLDMTELYRQHFNQDIPRWRMGSVHDLYRMLLEIKSITLIIEKISNTAKYNDQQWKLRADLKV